MRNVAAAAIAAGSRLGSCAGGRALTGASSFGGPVPGVAARRSLHNQAPTPAASTTPAVANSMSNKTAGSGRRRRGAPVKTIATSRRNKTAQPARTIGGPHRSDLPSNSQPSGPAAPLSIRSTQRQEVFVFPTRRRLARSLLALVVRPHSAVARRSASQIIGASKRSERRSACRRLPTCCETRAEGRVSSRAIRLCRCTGRHLLWTLHPRPQGRARARASGR